MKKRIEAMVDRALSWAGHHLDLFRAADSRDSRAETTLKPLVELSLLCMLHRRRADSHADRRIGEMLAISAETWQARHGCDRLVRNPEAFRLYAMWHESLVQAGALGDVDRHVIQAVINHGYVTATEEVGFRDLDLRHLLDLGGYRHHLPSYRSLYRQTVLGRGGPPLSFTHIDVYSVTHTLFYLSDFGARPIDAIPARERPHVQWIVQTLLAQYLFLEDWDIVAELLLGAACLRWTPPDALYTAAWNGLLDAQRDDGSIPSRSFEEAAWINLPEPERRAYAFEHTYHTTLAAAIAGLTIGPPPAAVSQSIRSSQRELPRKLSVEASRSQDWRSVAESVEGWLASLLQIDLSAQQAVQVLVGLWLTHHRGNCNGGGVDLQTDTPLAAAARRTAELLGVNEIDPGRLVGIDCHLLAALGHSPSIDPPDVEELNTLCQRLGPDIFRFDEPARARLTMAVLAAGTFGHRPLQGVDDAMRLAVSTWALTSLQQRDLERGAMLLRAANALCPAGDPSIAAGAAFLMMQQRADGAFGFLAPERERLSEIRPDSQPELDVTLPITVAVLWCLAEVLRPDLRLYPAPTASNRTDVADGLMSECERPCPVG